MPVMNKIFVCTFLFALSGACSPIVAQEADEFLLPLSPSGEEIRDRDLLTRRDQQKAITKAAPVVKPKTPSVELLDQKSSRYRTIQEQLQELSVFFEHMQKDGTTPVVQEPNSNADELSAVADTVVELPIPKVEEFIAVAPNESQKNVTPMSEYFSATNSASDDSVVTTTEDQAANSQVVIPTQELDGPVDRFALATSLFAVGHFSESLQAIDAVQLADLTTEEQIWLDYLRAGCHRQLGATSEANRLYRRIVANPESDWVGELSRWWLDHSSEKQKLSADYLTLANALKQWETAIHEITK